MRNYLRTTVLLWTAAIWLVPPIVSGGKEMTDAHKKEVVYKMYAEYKKQFPEVKDIMPQEAMELLKNEEVVFVDTRKPAEMEVSMLPNAISKKEFLKNHLKFKNQILVGYCTISYRSGVFAEKMAKEGINIYNLTGGLLAWVLEGGQVYDAKGETKRIHVYGNKWNYAPTGYQSIMFGFFDKIFN